MALIVFQRFFILTGNLKESHVTLLTRKWRSHTTLGFGIAACGKIYSGWCKLQELGNKKNTPFCKNKFDPARNDQIIAGYSVLEKSSSC
jgi:hypothetical protein